MPDKKKTSKKTVKKTKPMTAKKTAASKKAVTKKKAATKKMAAKKTNEKKAHQAKSGKAPKKTAASAKKIPHVEKEDPPASTIAKEEVSRRVSEALKKRTEKKERDRARKNAPATFSMTEVRAYLKKQKKAENAKSKGNTPSPTAAATAEEKGKPAASSPPSRSKQSFGAVSVADILGFDPTNTPETEKQDANEAGIAKKHLTYFRMLLKLHEDVREGLHRHSEQTLRRSSKEDSGDLSSYGQHMADAGTDSFERDFALSMVSSEQDALYEIDEAIRRIRNGTYGVCEITGKPISRDRLKAVPFARYSVEGQAEMEKGRRKPVQKAGLFGLGGEESSMMTDEDADE